MSLPPSPPPLPSTSAPPLLPPATSSPMTAIMSGTITTTAPATTTTTADPPPLLTPEEVSGTLRELVQAVRGITLYLAGNQPPPPSAATIAYGPPPLQWPAPAFQAPYGGAPPPPLLLPHYSAAGTPWPAWPTATASLGGPPQQFLPAPPPAPTTPATVQQHHQAPPPSTAPPPAPRPTGRPLHQVQFPPSPSPIPAWVAGSSPDPVYTTAPEHPIPALRFDHPSSSTNYAPEIPDPAHALLLTAAPGHGGPTPPRFAKLDFATYDGTEDPLN
nr:leucine-rich repeat extensin-like protein 2 [Aegilops tauschii subsp. strangulata]